MFTPNFIGFGLLILCTLLFLFKMLTYLMEREEIEIYTIEQAFGVDWVDHLPEGLQGLALTISDISFFYILGIGGVIFVVIGMFRK